MNNVIVSMTLSFVSGVLGTSLGGVLSVLISRPSRRLLSWTLAFAAGIMFSMVAFDLMPAAFERGELYVSIPGLALGVLLMLTIDMIIPNKSAEAKRMMSSSARFRRTGIMIALGIGIHNFAEGLAIGSGYIVTHGLGIGMAIAMMIHDIPEGLAMATPLRMGGVSSSRVIGSTLLAGLPTALGGLIGGLLGGITDKILCVCLSLAGGAMLSIVADRLLPDAKEAWDGRSSNIGFGVGVILGIILAVKS